MVAVGVLLMVPAATEQVVGTKSSITDAVLMWKHYST